VQKKSPQLIRDLVRREGASLVTCYVPIARTGNDVKQNGIRIKNCQHALATAHVAGGVDERTLAAAARELARAAENIENPRAPRPAGVALFASADECVAVESTTPFAASVTIAPRYYVVPLVPVTAPAPSAFVLALSRHVVRLIDAATAQELPLPRNAPRSLTDAVGTERRTPTLQQHSVGTGAVFHGRGEGDDDVLPEIEIYCRRLATALAGELGGDGRGVVLAGDVQITATFRRIAIGWPLLAEHIHGNHDRTPSSQLAAFALPLLAARESARQADLRLLYGTRSAEQRASDDPRDIAAAARDGRIDTLLLERAAALDEPALRAAREPHAVQPEGPFNSETVLTLRCGGEVCVVPAAAMPTRSPQAAIFRF
jgi:hypothetical protein